MPASSTMSPTGRSPSRSACTMRRRVGSASASKGSSCIYMYIYHSAYIDASRSGGWCPDRRRVLFLLAGCVVRFQIAERVLHACEQVFHHRFERIDALVVPEGHVEHPPLSIALDPAEAVVMIRTRIAFLQPVQEAHLVVVDARQH